MTWQLSLLQLSAFCSIPGPLFSFVSEPVFQVVFCRSVEEGITGLEGGWGNTPNWATERDIWKMKIALPPLKLAILGDGFPSLCPLLLLSSFLDPYCGLFLSYSSLLINPTSSFLLCPRVPPLLLPVALLTVQSRALLLHDWGQVGLSWPVQVRWSPACCACLGVRRRVLGSSVGSAQRTWVLGPPRSVCLGDHWQVTLTPHASISPSAKWGY